MPAGMSGLFANGQGILADPYYSGWRVLNPYTAAVLFSGNTAGTGYIGSVSGTFLDARVNGGGYGAGFLWSTISGVNASATILVSPDSANWSALSSINNTAGSTAYSQFSGYYPYIAARADWISAGARTAFVTIKLSLR